MGTAIALPLQVRSLRPFLDKVSTLKQIFGEYIPTKDPTLRFKLGRLFIF